MLVINDVEIKLQNCGSVLGVFLIADDPVAIERQYYAFFNHEATSGDLEWWTPTCALFWVRDTRHDGAEERFKKALTRISHGEMMTRKTKGSDPWAKACVKANERFEQVEWVTWWRMSASEVEIYGLGQRVKAERETGNWNDDVLAPVVTVGKGALQPVIIEDEFEPQSEEKSTDRKALSLDEACEVGAR